MVCTMFANSPFSFLCSDNDSAQSTELKESSGGDGLEVVEVEPAELALFDGLLDVKGFKIITDPESRSPKSNEIMTSSNTDSELEKYLRGQCSSDCEEVQQSCEEESSRMSQICSNVSPSSSVEYHYSNSNSSAINAPCMSKNAIAARENRQKKKLHLHKLEETVTNLRQENSKLKNRIETMSNTVESLETEVKYLKGVIANQSTISQLLGSIQKTPGIRFHTSFSLDREETKSNENEQVSKLETNSKSRKRNFVAQETDKSETENMSKNEPPEKVGAVSTRSSAKRVLPRTRVEPLQQKSSNLSLSVCSTPKPGTQNQSSTDTKQTFSQNGLISSDKQVKDDDIENNCTVQTQMGGAGVCLHVTDGSVSIEFCSTCAANASKIRKPQSCERKRKLRR